MAFCFGKSLLMSLYCFSVTFLEAKASCDVQQPPPTLLLLSQPPTVLPTHLHVQHTHRLVISTVFCLTQCFEFTVSVNFFCLLNREALDKAEKATERLAAVSKDVIKALELANPKETKK